MFWRHHLPSGSTPGAHLGASIDKSIESDEEMNDFRDELQNEACELEIQSGSLKLSLARPLSIKATFLRLKLISGSTPTDKSNVLEVKIELWLDAC